MRSAALIAVIGVLVVVAYAALAAVQILVLNPLAAAPRLSLAEIRVEMDARNESLGHGAVLAFLGFGVALATVAAIVCVVRRASARLTAAIFLGLLVLGSPAYFVASFGPGMALADTFWISGGDASPWAMGLHTTSFAALLVLVPVVVRWPRPRPRTAVPTGARRNGPTSAQVAVGVAQSEK